MNILKVQQNLSFSFSKAKVIGGFVIWTLLVLLFVLIMVACLVYGRYWYVFVGTSFLILLFLAWLDQLKFLQRYLQGRPALQLTPQALIDNINNISFAWKDIQEFKEASVNVGKGARKPYIAIRLYNEADYLALVQGWRNRMIARLNSRFFGGAFTIETNAIQESEQEVLKSLNDFRSKFSA